MFIGEQTRRAEWVGGVSALRFRCIYREAMTCLSGQVGRTKVCVRLCVSVAKKSPLFMLVGYALFVKQENPILSLIFIGASDRAQEGIAYGGPGGEEGRKERCFRTL